GRLRTSLAERGDDVGDGRIRGNGAVDGGGRDVRHVGLCRSATHTRDRRANGVGRSSGGRPQIGISGRAVAWLGLRRVGAGRRLRAYTGVGGAVVQGDGD